MYLSKITLHRYFYLFCLIICNIILTLNSLLMVQFQSLKYTNIWFWEPVAYIPKQSWESANSNLSTCLGIKLLVQLRNTGLIWLNLFQVFTVWAWPIFCMMVKCDRPAATSSPVLRNCCIIASLLIRNVPASSNIMASPGSTEKRAPN